jgi:two-component system sensor histidine kinase KdpD
LTGAVETLVTHDETLGPDGRAEVYEILQRSTRRVSEWIGALLEESLGPTRVMPSTRPVELGPLLEEAAENARAATAGLAVTVDDSDVLVEADPGLVIRVLTNLLANAGHHAADGGTVEVRALERGDRVQVRVVDHGPGFDLDDLPDRSASPSDLAGRDGPGLGIGLDSARSVVQSWGGQFGIGRTPGGGATVWFTLPLTRGRTGGGEQPTEREAAATDRGPLETTGAACGTARSAEEAEEAEAGDGRLVRWTVVGPAPGSSAAVFRQRRPRP